MTEWRAIPGFSQYVISRDGEIARQFDSPKNQFKAGCRIKFRINPYGYFAGMLTDDDGKARCVRLHVLLLSTFVGPRPYGFHGSHLNGIKTNNDLQNLVWESSSENQQRKLEHGTLVHGNRHKLAKLTPENVIEIRARLALGSRGIGKELATEFGVTKTKISQIKFNKAWMHVDQLIGDQTNAA